MIGVAAGLTLGVLTQAALYLSLRRLALRERPLLVYAAGMMLRLVVVGTAALWVVPASGLPAAPTLFALVATLFVSTLLEPVLFDSNFRTFR